ncbi:MAG TPA: PadR family transcriptional regulator [Solibacterales bacterium]|nr:PadR family transcriptional regulator [Bryobacterales bacterium]
MAKGDFLGEFEQLVLMAVLRLGGDAYGMTVRREIEVRAGREVTVGAVYATLDRLESKGYVHSKEGEATAERGGRAKRLFEVTGAGQAALETAVAALQRMSKGLGLAGGRA